MLPPLRGQSVRFPEVEVAAGTPAPVKGKG